MLGPGHGPRSCCPRRRGSCQTWGQEQQAAPPGVGRHVPAPPAHRLPCPRPHVCPISWAMVNAVARPISSLMLQLLSRSHIPPTGARPGEWAWGWGGARGSGLCLSVLPTLPGPHPHRGQCHPAHRLQRRLKPRGPGYLVCRRVCSCRCRCHSCGRRRGSQEAGRPPKGRPSPTPPLSRPSPAPEPKPHVLPPASLGDAGVHERPTEQMTE